MSSRSKWLSVPKTVQHQRADHHLKLAIANEIQWFPEVCLYDAGSGTDRSRLSATESSFKSIDASIAPQVSNRSVYRSDRRPASRTRVPPQLVQCDRSSCLHDLLRVQMQQLQPKSFIGKRKPEREQRQKRRERTLNPADQSG